MNGNVKAGWRGSWAAPRSWGVVPGDRGTEGAEAPPTAGTAPKTQNQTRMEHTTRTPKASPDSAPASLIMNTKSATDHTKQNTVAKKQHTYKRRTPDTRADNQWFRGRCPGDATRTRSGSIPQPQPFPQWSAQVGLQGARSRARDHTPVTVFKKEETKPYARLPILRVAPTTEEWQRAECGQTLDDVQGVSASATSNLRVPPNFQVPSIQSLPKSNHLGPRVSPSDLGRSCPPPVGQVPDKTSFQVGKTQSAIAVPVKDGEATPQDTKKPLQHSWTAAP